MLRFKKSAALAATRDIKLSGIQPGNDALIQTIVDNFYSNISSQNGTITTDSLATLISQPGKALNMESNDTVEHDNILRISKPDLKESQEHNIPVSRYQGPKIVSMTEQFSNKGVLPLKVPCSTIMSERRAKEFDLEFMTDVINTESCPKYIGYNTRVI